MKKKELTKEFLISNVMENYIELLFAAKGITNRTDEDWSKEFKNMLADLVETLNQDEDLIENDDDLKKLKEIKEEIATNYTSHNDYQNCMELFFDYDTIVADEYEDYEEIKKKIEYVSELCREYENIIKCFPDVNYTVDFSCKSPSLYLATEMVPTEENCHEFDVNKFGWERNDIYENYSDEDRKDMKELEIRLSDHDFGSCFSEIYGDISYEHACINIFRR